MLAKHLKSIVKKFGTIAPSKQESISNKIFDVKAGKGISKTIEFAKIDKEIVSQNKSGCLMAKNSISEDAHAKFKSSTWKNNLSEKPTIKVPWFPQCESDLDLFGNMLTFVFRKLNDEVYDFLFSNIESFSQSRNNFVAQVQKVLKKQKDICESVEVKIIEVKAIKEREMPSFVLADAFLRRDKKAAFVALHDELATKPPEEVHGGLWYQMKNMALIFSGATEEESGLHPFVYKKIKSASIKFSKKECDEIFKTLLEMNHKAHRGEKDFEVALEQFILRFT